MRGLLSRESEFAGFKRSYIREHKDEYKKLYEMLYPPLFDMDDLPA